MNQTKNWQTPPKAMHNAMAAFTTAQREVVARGVANFGALPRNMSTTEREAVTTMARRLLKPN